MSRKNNILFQFDDLIERLKATEKRPFKPDAVFKDELRRRLIAQHAQPHPFWQTSGQWLGTAVSAGILALIVYYAWSVLFAPAPISAPPPATNLAELTPLAEEGPRQHSQRAQLPAEFGDSFLLLDYDISPPETAAGQPLRVHLYLETTARPSANYTVYLHLIDADGNLAAQADHSLGESATFVRGVRPVAGLTLWLPDNPEAGPFSLVTGLYDSSTGQRLPQNDSERGFVLAEIEAAGNTAVFPRAVVSGTGHAGLTLRSAPAGQPIAILSEGSIVLLSEFPRQESENALWQAVETADGLTGWVMAEFLTYPAGYTPVGERPLENTLATGAESPVRLLSAVQKARLSAVVTIEIEIETSATETMGGLQLYLTNPDTALNLPITNPAQLFRARAGAPGLIITATPEQIREATGTDYPVVTAVFWPTDASSDTAIIQQFPEFAIDLTSREEIRYEPPSVSEN